MTPAAPIQPSMVDLMQAQILEFGWCITGSTVKYNQGDIIRVVHSIANSDEKVAQPLSVAGLATDKDVDDMIALLNQVFPNAYIPARPAGYYWYRCVTD